MNLVYCRLLPTNLKIKTVYTKLQLGIYVVFYIRVKFDLSGDAERGRVFNPLKPKHVQTSVRTSKRTPQFTITKINWVTLFKQIITDYAENHTKPINKNCQPTFC
jgi:hypothetical protein